MVVLFYYENPFFKSQTMQPFRYFMQLNWEKIKRKGTFPITAIFLYRVMPFVVLVF